MIMLASPRKNRIIPNTKTRLNGKLVCIFQCSDIFFSQIFVFFLEANIHITQYIYKWCYEMKQLESSIHDLYHLTNSNWPINQEPSVSAVHHGKIYPRQLTTIIAQLSWCTVCQRSSLAHHFCAFLPPEIYRREESNKLGTKIPIQESPYLAPIDPSVWCNEVPDWLGRPVNVVHIFVIHISIVLVGYYCVKVLSNKFKIGSTEDCACGTNKIIADHILEDCPTCEQQRRYTWSTTTP